MTATQQLNNWIDDRKPLSSGQITSTRDATGWLIISVRFRSGHTLSATLNREQEKQLERYLM